MDTAAVTAAIQHVTEEIILPRFGALDSSDMKHKSPGDLVTIADQEAEVALGAIFAAYTPQALVVGEEAISAHPHLLDGVDQAEQAWVIDPVDGTNNFARGSDNFGVMVAELRRGITTRAWIWQPRYHKMFVAERGAGVWLNDQRLIRTIEGDEDIRAAVPKGLRHHLVPGFQLQGTVRACAVDYPMVLEGQLDALAYRKQHPWDHLPGTLMITELGGHCATHEGDEYRLGVYGKIMIAAASQSIWTRTDQALITPAWLAAHGLHSAHLHHGAAPAF